MTAFKEKVLQALKPEEREKITKEEFEKIAEESNFGLAEYPVLMAADILIFGGQLVPVGNDQLQHLEFARMLVRKFNKKFGKTFMEPKAILTPTPRLMSLDDPSKKMSKSHLDGCLFIDDEPKIIEMKIKAAITDSGNEVKYDRENKPGISNLLDIMSSLSGKSTQEIEQSFSGKNYSEIKKSIAKFVADYFAPFREKKSAWLKKTADLKKVLSSGSKKASEIADKKISEIKGKIGIIT